MSLDIKLCTFVPLDQVAWDGGWLDHYGCGTSWLPTNPNLYYIIAASHAIPYWLSIRLSIQVLVTFKSWRTLYFWSILATNLGIVLYTVAWDISDFTNASGHLYANLQNVGMIFMMLGFALVLYSRLHLVIQNPQVARVLLPTLLWTLLICNTTVFTLRFMCTFVEASWVVTLLNVTTKFEILFSVQEVVMASLYVYFLYRLLLVDKLWSTGRKMFLILCAVQLVVLLCDVAMTTTAWLHLVHIRSIINPIFYAIKLELEFVVLNRLVKFSHSRAGRLEVVSAGTGDVEDHRQISNADKLAFSGAEAVVSERPGSDSTMAGSDLMAWREPSSATTIAGQSSQENSIYELERRYLGRDAV